jgi:hypothetical protein
MAFFSIALTLNLTGVRLTDLRLANLRPTAIRSFMERRITMASTPIIRYYDHLRLVYEVQSRMRELRRNSQTTEGQQQNNTQPATPGESKQIPHKDGGSRVDPPQQSGVPATNDSLDYLETSLTLNGLPHRYPSSDLALGTLVAHSGGFSPELISIARDPVSAIATRERSEVWTA